jgi:hypothetical protein
VNRREALKSVAVLPLLAMNGAESDEIRYKDTEWTVWTERLAGQEVEFSKRQDWGWGYHKVKGYWRSHETPRVAYSLGFRVSDEEVMDIGYDAAVTHSAKMRKLRGIMADTVRHVHWGDSGAVIAPIKPEGAAFVFME